MQKERDKLWEVLLIIKNKGISGFENPQTLKMTNDAKVKKWLPSNIQIQGTVNKLLSKD